MQFTDNYCESSVDNWAKAVTYHFCESISIVCLILQSADRLWSEIWLWLDLRIVDEICVLSSQDEFVQNKCRNKVSCRPAILTV